MQLAFVISQAFLSYIFFLALKHFQERSIPIEDQDKSVC